MKQKNKRKKIRNEFKNNLYSSEENNKNNEIKSKNDIENINNKI